MKAQSLDIRDIQKWIALVLFFIAGTSAVAAETGRPPVRIQSQSVLPFFSGLKKILKNNGSVQWELCHSKTRACEILTREISPQEAQGEQQILEKHLKSRFRASVAPGVLLFMENKTCTLAGAVIAAVPGYAGGAMICFGNEGSTPEIFELPYNIQSLENLEHKFKNQTSLIANGIDGEVYVANPLLIIQYLKSRFPISSL